MQNVPNEEELFLAAIDIADREERMTFVRKSCEGNQELEIAVRELLSFHEDNDTFLEDQVVSTPMGLQLGDIVDVYEITGVLGEGGCGIVYRAKQEQPISREVALKVLKAGMDSAAVVARFEQERQTLALLTHPQIAAVIDAGATDAGRPYFVMELVDGLPMDEFCDSQRLSIRNRIDVMLQVCAAVQHAHQKGIIHRDLKPTNILVSGRLENDKSAGNGVIGALQVKVIDFGIAKAIEGPANELTQQGLLLGTPDYMSPEQRERAQDIDIRSDVYALGALLVQLLTGRPPSFRTLKNGRALLQDSLVLPSSQVGLFEKERLQTVALKRREISQSLSKVLVGDLDWISRKALSHAPNDRYASVSEFASDLRAFLKHEPVAAGPPTWTYRAKKFVRRNQLASVLIACVIFSVLAGTTLSTFGFLRADRARKSALLERDKSQATMEMMQRFLSLGHVHAGHKADFTVRQMLDEFSDSLDSELRADLIKQPTVEANLRQTLGKSYWSLGLMARAGAHLERAMELRRGLVGPDDAETVRSEIDYAKYLASTSQLKAADDAIQHAMPILSSTFDSAELAWAHHVLAKIARERGEFESSLENARKAYDVANRVLGGDHPTSVYLETELAPIHLELMQYKEADLASENALSHARRLGENTYNSATASRNRAIVLASRGNLSEAADLIRDAIQIDRVIVGETSSAVVLDLTTYANIYRRQKMHRRAEKAARSACEYAENITVEPGIIKPQAYNELAHCISGRYPQEAIELWEKAIEEKRKLKTTSPLIGRYLEGQASCYRQLGDLERAAAKYRQCISLLKDLSTLDIQREGTRIGKRRKPASEFAKSAPLLVSFHLTTLLLEHGRDEAAVLHARQTVERARATGYDRDQVIADLLEAVILLYEGDAIGAETLIDGVLANERVWTEMRAFFAWAQAFKAEALLRQNQTEKARELLESLQVVVQRRKFSDLKVRVDQLSAELP